MAATAGHHDAVRDHILDAAHRVIARHGLAAASTRAIAAEAGLGAGTLYNYLDNRRQLLARAILRRAHLLSQPLADLPSRAGSGTVAGNLRDFTRQVSTILEELVPLFAAAFSDADLLDALRHELGTGAHGVGTFAAHPIERYLLAEQELGRIASDADCHAAAALVLSLCHDRAFARFFRGATGNPEPLGREIDLIAHAVTAPQPSRPETGKRTRSRPTKGRNHVR
jgi:AcrR family transcriptional regulator